MIEYDWGLKGLKFSDPQLGWYAMIIYHITSCKPIYHFWVIARVDGIV